ncbi:MAG: hypothetical protein F4X64_05780 [Chloroflexi bacterium]|nr:hypothetical protein [Chloroflexota bacterium]
MATAKDVVDSLVEQTKAGKIEWTPGVINFITGNPDWWSTQIDDGCRVEVYSPQQGIVRASNGGVASLTGDDNVQELYEVVASMFPADAPSSDEVLSMALDCIHNNK